MARQKIDQAAELAARHSYEELRVLVADKKKANEIGNLILFPVLAAMGWGFFSLTRLLPPSAPPSTVVDWVLLVACLAVVVVFVVLRFRLEDSFILFSDALARKAPRCGNCGQRLPETHAVALASQAQRSPVKRPEL